MQMVSTGDHLHEMSNPVFLEKKISLLSAELAQRIWYRLKQSVVG